MHLWKKRAFMHTLIQEFAMVSSDGEVCQLVIFTIDTDTLYFLINLLNKLLLLLFNNGCLLPRQGDPLLLLPLHSQGSSKPIRVIHHLGGNQV